MSNRSCRIFPLRLGNQGLSLYRWSGHSALLGIVAKDWQDRKTILASFGSDVEKARERYERFVGDGIALGSRPELAGGGLVRSHGNWSQVVSLRKKGEAVSSDARILGSSDFVDRLLSEVEKKEKDTSRLCSGKCDLPVLLSGIAVGNTLEASAICNGVRTRKVVYARKLLSQIAVRTMGYSGAEVARFLGITTSAVNRLVSQEELPEVKQYSKR